MKHKLFYGFIASLLLSLSSYSAPPRITDAELKMFEKRYGYSVQKVENRMNQIARSYFNKILHYHSKFEDTVSIEIETFKFKSSDSKLELFSLALDSLNKNETSHKIRSSNYHFDTEITAHLLDFYDLNKEKNVLPKNFVDTENKEHLKNKFFYFKQNLSFFNLILHPTSKLIENPIHEHVIYSLFFWDYYHSNEIEKVSQIYSEFVHKLTPYQEYGLEYLIDHLIKNPNYPKIYQMLSKYGVKSLIEEKLNKELPPILGEEVFPSLMKEGEEGLFLDLKKGLQKNGLINLFTPYIGKRLEEIPHYLFENNDKQAIYLMQKLLFNFSHIPQVELETRETIMDYERNHYIVWHRTQNPEVAEKVNRGEIISSIGTQSALGGGAGWGKGVYAGLSPNLFHYGPFMVKKILNPKVILGKDFDIFLGQGDGYIIVVKNKDAFLQTSEGESGFDRFALPFGSEPVENYFYWVFENYAHLSKKQRSQFIKNFIRSIPTNRSIDAISIFIMSQIFADDLTEPLYHKLQTSLENPNMLKRATHLSALDPSHFWFYMLLLIETSIERKKGHNIPKNFANLTSDSLVAKLLESPPLKSILKYYPVFEHPSFVYSLQRNGYATFEFLIRRLNKFSLHPEIFQLKDFQKEIGFTVKELIRTLADENNHLNRQVIDPENSNNEVTKLEVYKKDIQDQLQKEVIKKHNKLHTVLKDFYDKVCAFSP